MKISNQIKNHVGILEIEVNEGSNSITHEYAGYTMELSIDVENDIVSYLELLEVLDKDLNPIELKPAEVYVIETYLKKFTEFVYLDKPDPSEIITDPYEFYGVKRSDFI